MMQLWCQNGCSRERGSEVLSDVIQTSALRTVVFFTPMQWCLNNVSLYFQIEFSDKSKKDTGEKITDMSFPLSVSPWFGTRIILQAPLLLYVFEVPGERHMFCFFSEVLLKRVQCDIEAVSCSERGSVVAQAGRSAGLAGKQRRCVLQHNLFLIVHQDMTWTTSNIFPTSAVKLMLTHLIIFSINHVRSRVQKFCSQSFETAST